MGPDAIRDDFLEAGLDPGGEAPIGQLERRVNRSDEGEQLTESLELDIEAATDREGDLGFDEDPREAPGCNHSARRNAHPLSQIAPRG